MSNPNYLLDDGLPPLQMPSAEEVQAFRKAMGPSRDELMQIALSHYEYRRAADAMLRRMAEDMDLLLRNPDHEGLKVRCRQLVDSIRAMPELPTPPEENS